MGLSDELISQFAKITKDDNKTKSETTVYGTVVEYNGSNYVKLDGSELLTPVSTTTNTTPGDRVTVLIKNHNATVTGNLSSPSAKNSDLQLTSNEVKDVGSAITKFEIVLAGKVDTTEFNAEVARIDTLSTENATIKNTLTAAEANIGILQAKDANIEERLKATEASIQHLEAGDVSVETLKATFATVENLNAVEQNVVSLEGELGDFKQLTADDFTAVTGAIDELDVNKLSVTEAKATYATIANLNAATADITSIEGTFASFQTTTTNRLNAVNADIEELNTKKLSAADIDGKFANIDFSNIGEAAIEAFISKSGLIENAVIGDGTVTGRLVGVTIKGDLIEAGTLVADKLVMLGTDGLYYKLNTNGETTEVEQTNYNSINGNILTAQSVTASKISVDDLVAFDATIGGFKITEDSLYSGVKSSVENTTRGIYLDNTGQMSVGDSTNFIRYYKDGNGNYKLAISADELTLSSENKSVATAINELSEANQTNSADLANYMTIVNSEMASMQGQIDGSIMTHFYEYEPTNNNIPANEWTTVALKNNHLGDLFYDTDTGYCYRWQIQNGVYSWNRLTDVDVTKALADAHAAQKTADNKARVFISTPVAPYDVGDLWVQGTSGDILKCQTAKTSSQSYAAADWIKASKYTDDTAANAAQADANALKSRMSTAETSITENAKAIELRATKTEVAESLSGYYTKEQADSNLTVKANEISTSVASTYATKTALDTTNTNVTNVQTDVDNLEIGGRNLFGFHKNVVFTGMTNHTTIAAKHINGYIVTIDSAITENIIASRIQRLGFAEFGPGYYSYSAEIYATNDITVSIDICDKKIGTFDLTSEPQKITGTVEVTNYYTADAYNGFSDIETASAPEGTIIYVANVKIEKGNRCTSWTQAPEDIVYEIGSVETRVSTAETKITENAEAISLRATKTEVTTAKTEAINSANTNTVNALKNYSTTAEMNAAIELKANGITSIVSSTYATKSDLNDTNTVINNIQNGVNNIQVGGRNLVLGTSDSFSMPISDEITSLRTSRAYDISPMIRDDAKEFFLNMKDGSSLTLSFDINIPKIKADSSQETNRVGVYFQANFTHTNGTITYWYGTHNNTENTMTNKHTLGDNRMNSLIALTSTEESIVGTYACSVAPVKSIRLQDFYENPDDYTVEFKYLQLNIHGYTTGGTISNIKLEKGNSPTDWTPAPEDLESRVAATENDVITAQSAADTANNNVNNLKVGARNYAQNTATGKTHTITTVEGNDSWYTSDSYWKHGILLEQDVEYTVSFDYTLDWTNCVNAMPTNYNDSRPIGPGIGSGHTIGGYHNDAYAIIADLSLYGDGYESGKFVYTFKANHVDGYPYFAFRMIRSYNSFDITGLVVTINNFKFEKGNRATDWSPAPEDVQTEIDTRTYAAQSVADEAVSRITTAESVIEQLANSISTLVQDENGTSLMTQTETGWVFSVAEIQNGIDKASEDLNTLVEEVGTVDNAVQVLQQAVDDLGILGDYIHIGLYEDEPCIELGELDSDFKVLITNTRIMFKEGSSTPTYISNQTLITEKINVTEELKQGNFVWSVRSNGNYGLIWKEG